MRMGRVTAWALATLALMGCSSAPVSPPGPSGDSSPTASPTPSTSPSSPAGPLVWLPEWADARTPQDVVNRGPLPFCGIEEAPVPRPGEYFDATIRNCFWSAKLDRREAEFVSVQPTMEGDRIATIYRLRPDGGVDLLLDSTQDRFGGGGWTITTCESLVAAEGAQLFAPDACGEPRPL